MTDSCAISIKREHTSGMYRVGNYFFSKMICEVKIHFSTRVSRNTLVWTNFLYFFKLPKFIIFPLIFTAICYWMANLNGL